MSGMTHTRFTALTLVEADKIRRRPALNLRGSGQTKPRWTTANGLSDGSLGGSERAALTWLHENGYISCHYQDRGPDMVMLTRKGIAALSEERS